VTANLPIAFGREVCGSLEEGVAREWLVTDGLGGYACGTVAGLHTRRYHGLLMHATGPAGGARSLGLVALDTVVVIGDQRIRLATHEWAGGAIDPRGYEHLARFDLEDGVPRWHYDLGPVQLEVELAMAYGACTVGVVHRLLAGAATLEVTPLCTWRDQHGDRYGGADPAVESSSTASSLNRRTGCRARATSRQGRGIAVSTTARRRPAGSGQSRTSGWPEPSRPP
jgi:hypothetical protein